MIVATTTVYCTRCRATHRGDLVREGDRVLGRVACPAGARETVLSGDAELFLELRRRSRLGAEASGAARASRPLLNLIEITDTCNFRCPICYNQSKPQRAPNHLTPEEVVRRAIAVKAKGALNVTLTGGEPTEHPRLAEIIARVKAAGMRVNIPSNGYNLGTRPGLAQELKAAGLFKVTLQLDTLDAEVHQKLRGNAFIPEKLRAFKSCCDAGLSLGIAATVNDLNLAEVPRLVELAISYVPSLMTIAFQVASTEGRYELENEHTVDREAVINQLVGSATIPGLRAHNFWPLPPFRPLGLNIHPDCGASLFLLVDDHGCRPLDELVDIEAFYRRLGTSTAAGNFATRNLLPLAYLARSSRKLAAPARVAQHLYGMLSKKSRRGLVIVGAGSFVPQDFADEDRYARCPTTISTARGPMSPCLHFRDQVTGQA